MKRLVVLITSLTILTGFTGYTRGGFSGGGGGTSVIYQGHRVLLDLLMFPEYRSQVLKSTYKADDPYLSAIETLKKWDEKSLSIGSTMAGISFGASVNWELVNEDFELSDRYFTPDDLAISSPKTVAYYLKGKPKSVTKISRSGLDELNGLSQVGLIIHETLRNIQIGWDKNNNGFNERSLQEATAIYVLCKPSYTLAMYANFILFGQSDIAEQEFGPLNEVLKEYCKGSGL